MWLHRQKKVEMGSLRIIGKHLPGMSLYQAPLWASGPGSRTEAFPALRGDIPVGRWAVHTCE